MHNKNDLRRFAKEKRKNIDLISTSDKILRIFFDSIYFINSKNIALYYPYNNELDITPILSKKNKNCFLPKINQDSSMTFHRYFNKKNLINDEYGILSPNSQIADPQSIDLWILPALLADKKGFRLGYGKGFYDKFFAQNNITATKIIFIPNELLMENLPTEKYDIPANIIITETEIIYPK